MASTTFHVESVAIDGDVQAADLDLIPSTRAQVSVRQAISGLLREVRPGEANAWNVSVAYTEAGGISLAFEGVA